MASETNLTSTPIVAIVRAAGFEKYDKIKHTNVMNSNDTGVCLRPEAFRAVADVYPEYAYSMPGVVHPRKRRKYPENRKKQHALRVRLGDAMYATVRRWMQEDGHKTAQAFLEKCILAYGTVHGKDMM